MPDIVRTEPSRLYVPALGRVYDALADVAWVVLRIVVGANFIPHGLQKAFGAFGGPGISGFAGWLGSQGFPAPTLFAVLIMLTELVGGTLITIGLFTRPAALAAFAFMAMAVAFHFPLGFFWSAGGFEYPLMWAVGAFFFLVRGGGPLSVDRALAKEF